VSTVNTLLRNNGEIIDIFDSASLKTFKLTNNIYTSRNNSFIDYIEKGFNIALSIGIDFSLYNKSNGCETLHYIGDSSSNLYQKVIRSFGGVVEVYEYDQLVRCYGYGADAAGLIDNKCFNLNLEENPNIKGIEGVLQCYNMNIIFPKSNYLAHLAPLIQKLMNTIENDKNKNKKVYTVLIILTSGYIHDIDATVKALVDASHFPISVIIISMADSYLTRMHALNKKPLRDREKRRATRDFVQFVPFCKYENDGKKLAEQVLKEIPTQLIEYYRMFPDDPIVDNI
jgi:hypothetical protein